jgi:hypothetical protein
MAVRRSWAGALLALLAATLVLATASHDAEPFTTASTGRKLPSLPLPAPYSADYDPLMDPLDEALSSLDTAEWIQKELHRVSEAVSQTTSEPLGPNPVDYTQEPALAVITLIGTSVSQVGTSPSALVAAAEPGLLVARSSLLPSFRTKPGCARTRARCCTCWCPPLSCPCSPAAQVVDLDKEVALERAVMEVLSDCAASITNVSSAARRGLPACQLAELTAAGWLAGWLTG